MDLTQIRAVAVFRLVIEMLDGCASMRVAFHAETFDQRDRAANRFAKAMPAGRGHGGDQKHGRFLY